MALPKTGRYIRRNAADYILFILALLLLFSIAARFAVTEIAKRQDRDCTAAVSFRVCGLTEEEAAYLTAQTTPFLLADSGLSIGKARLTEQKPTTVQVEGEDGTLTPSPADARVDVYFSLTTSGKLAKDGSFLLLGTRRLAAGDRLTLIRGDGRYTAEFIGIQIS